MQGVIEEKCEAIRESGGGLASTRARRAGRIAHQVRRAVVSATWQRPETSAAIGIVARRETKERAAKDGEVGFSLIEVLVGMFLFAVTAIPMSSIFTGGVSDAALASHQSDAVGLASGALAKAQSVSYANLGFYDDQVSAATASNSWYQPDPNGDSYVSLGATTPAGATPVLSPVSSNQVGPLHYIVGLQIVWVAAENSAAGGGVVTDYQAYKQVTAQVRWAAAHGATDSIQESTILYSGNQGPYSGPGSGASSSSSSGSGSSPSTAPSTMSASTPSGSAGETSTVVNWSGGTVDSSGYYVVLWSTNPGDLPAANASGSGTLNTTTDVVASPHQASTSTSYSVEGLAPGMQYYYEVVAFSGETGDWSTSAIVDSTTSAVTSSSTAESSGLGTGSSVDPQCSVISLAVVGAGSGDTGKTYLNSDGRMSENLDLAVNATGCQGDTIQVTDQTEAKAESGCSSQCVSPQSEFTLSATAWENQSEADSPKDQGAQFTGTVQSAGESGWVTGQHVFSVTVNGAALDHPVTASMNVYPFEPGSERSDSQSGC